MIEYQRTKYFGVEYLLRWRGILVPRLLPIIIITAAISSIASYGWFGDICDEDGLFKHPYAYQLFGIIFGYFSVARLNVSLARYWEGVSMVKMMHSKWADAIIQIMAFDRQVRTLWMCLPTAHAAAAAGSAYALVARRSPRKSTFRATPSACR